MVVGEKDRGPHANMWPGAPINLKTALVVCYRYSYLIGIKIKLHVQKFEHTLES